MNGDLPETEARNDAHRVLDTLDTRALVETLAGDQRRAADAVVEAAPAIARAVDGIAERLRRGGRLHYAGAGTSGRLGVLDASEMPPTFGVAPELVNGHIAGGDAALRRSVEGAEDQAEAGASLGESLRADDVLIGISASGGAAYVVGAVERARAAGALTVAIVNSSGSRLGAAAEMEIVLRTGPEALTGSTRLKAGTSQKIALNAISTAVMVKLGKVYENLMVDVVASNVKLRARACRLVQTLTGVDATGAQALLDAAGGSVKVAAVMHARGVDAPQARALLEREHGFLRPLL